MEETARVFVCYSRCDSKAVDATLATLESKGHTFWIDRDSLVGSEVWEERIVNALQECDVVLYFASEDSVGSAHVGTELSLGRENSKPIIPFFLSSDLKPKGRVAYSIAGLHRIYRSDPSPIDSLDLAIRWKRSSEVLPQETRSRTRSRGKSVGFNMTSFLVVLLLAIAILVIRDQVKLAGTSEPINEALEGVSRSGFKSATEGDATGKESEVSLIRPSDEAKFTPSRPSDEVRIPAQVEAVPEPEVAITEPDSDYENKIRVIGSDQIATNEVSETASETGRSENISTGQRQDEAIGDVVPAEPTVAPASLVSPELPLAEAHAIAGWVWSPFQKGQVVDVSDAKPGDISVCPHSNKKFIIPEDFRIPPSKPAIQNQ